MSEARLARRTRASGLLLANLLVLPGLGSVIGGCRVGYLQALMALAGLGVSTGSLGYALWALIRQRTEWWDPADLAGGIDRAAALPVNWRFWLGWALAGMVAFAIGWFWSLWTGIELLRAERAQVPPVLG